MRLTDDQRRRLAAKGRPLGRELLGRVATIAKVLKEHGMAPAPDRPSSGRTFIKSHAAVIAAADFFTTEVWTARGLVTYYTLFVIDIATRSVHIVGTTVNPTSAWMAQAARNLADCMDGFLKGKRYLIVDRDVLFSEQFKAILKSNATKIVRTSIQAPNMNAFAERSVRSIKSECLDRMIFVGADSLDRAVREFTVHYHAERPHQGLESTLIRGGPISSDGRVEVRDRLGGLLKYYYRQAA